MTLHEVPPAPADEHDTVARIVTRVLGPLATELWSTRKFRQLARELRREDEWQEARVVDAEFERFFTLYPRKADKRRAGQIWRQVKRRAGGEWPALRAKIMSKAPHADANTHYRLGADRHVYTPLASTWLEWERWTDGDE